MRRLILTATLVLFTWSYMNGQSLDELLAQHYKAASQEKFSTIETIITSGENHMSMAGIQTAFTIFQARPDNIRIEILMRGNQVIQTYDGTKGWMYAPHMGIPEPKAMSGDEIGALMQQSSYENPLWNYQERGYTLDLSTDPETALEEMHHLVLTSPEGDIRHFYLDKEDLLIRSIHSTQVVGGSSQDVAQEFLDYKSFRGIPMATRIDTRMDGDLVNTIEIKKIEFNKRLDAKLFQKPSGN